MRKSDLVSSWQKRVCYHNFSLASAASYLKFLLEPARLLYSRISPKTKTVVAIAASPSATKCGQTCLAQAPKANIAEMSDKPNNGRCSLIAMETGLRLSPSIPGLRVQSCGKTWGLHSPMVSTPHQTSLGR